MPCVAREIVVTDLLLISATANPHAQHRHVSFQKPTASSIYATALFGGQCEGAYVSVNFVEKALGSQVFREHSDICSTARLTWHLAILSQTAKTSYLRVVYELDHDVVFGRGPECSNWKSYPVNPQPLYSGSTNCGGFQHGVPRIVAVAEALAELEDSKLDKTLADASFLISSASRLGIEFGGELSIKAFASLLRQHVEIIRHGRQSPVNNPLLLARSAASEIISRSEDGESPVSSGVDEDDRASEAFSTLSDMPWERNLLQLPSSSRGIDQAYTGYTTNTLMEAAQAKRGSSPGDSLGSWQLVGTASPIATTATTEDDGPAQANRAGSEERDDPSLTQGQMSDFDKHPGHKVWEWDTDRQRWRRRGRTGSEESDWFPESFA
ncbi:hypothetical protein NCS52_00335200 [Fusarium sp. LHS14.1]|nr:hypothetical protein NCS52_00335200 [Fusarium sp. LHS14.1]